MKIKSWNPKKEKKARFKRKLARLKKRGENVYGGYYELKDEDALEYLDMVISIGPEYFDEEGQEHMANRAVEMIEKGAAFSPEIARRIVADELCRDVIKKGKDIIFKE